MNRLHNLDYLRGLSAFGIMIYHYLFWMTGRFSADTFIGRIGVYGVALFYILSGLTLHYVYYNKMSPSIEEIIDFAKKRVFRIFPLLWLTTIVAIGLSKKKLPDVFDLFLNLTGLFGFIKWDTYFSTGVWSIGNELVFYVFFPFFILFTKSFKPLMVLFSIVIFALYIYFSFVILSPKLPLSEQWRDYINPLNQVFLFLSGFSIGLVLHAVKLKNHVTLLILFFGIGLFGLYPVSGDTINLVTGINRLIFTLSCMLICAGFYKSSIPLPTAIHKPMALLGEISYSVYLLHPIIYIFLAFFSKHIIQIPIPTMLIMGVLFTVVTSYIVYEYFEKYFINLSRKKKGDFA